MTVPQFVQQWTEQAAHDLEAARALRKAGFYDTCVVQCQQSAEKYLKALWPTSSRLRRREPMN